MQSGCMFCWFFLTPAQMKMTKPRHCLKQEWPPRPPPTESVCKSPVFCWSAINHLQIPHLWAAKRYFYIFFPTLATQPDTTPSLQVAQRSQGSVSRFCFQAAGIIYRPTWSVSHLHYTVSLYLMTGAATVLELRRHGLHVSLWVHISSCHNDNNNNNYNILPKVSASVFIILEGKISESGTGHGSVETKRQSWTFSGHSGYFMGGSPLPGPSASLPRPSVPIHRWETLDAVSTHTLTHPPKYHFTCYSPCGGSWR